MTCAHTEYLLGFTARPLPRDLDQEWPSDRRQTFLLNANAPEPTSVDAAGCAELSCVDSQTAETLGTTSIDCDVPLYRSCTPPGASSLAIWASQEGLIEFLEPHLGPPSQRCYALHAITLLSTHRIYRSSHDATSTSPRSSDSASSLDPSWVRLGFDVADIWLCSGLMNCGYTPSDRPHAARFTRSLNRFHLFDDVAIALDFARFTDERVEEHAPFHVFGMYQFQVR